MEQNRDSSGLDGAIDALVAELLECGAVLSQIVAHMSLWEAGGRTAPDTAPIPVVAHGLIRSALTDVRHQHSRRDLKVAAGIVKETRQAISENLFMVAVDDDSWADGEPGELGETSE